MPIDVSKVQWDSAPAIDASRVRWDEQIPQRQDVSAATKFGRAAASLADVVVGDIPAMVVGQVGYPLARAFGATPEQATRTVGAVTAPLTSPVGKLFGVEQTPEYQQEAGRQLMDFIGRNVNKGSQWISQQTGLPEADVQNMIGTATFAVPEATRATKAGVRAAGEAISNLPPVAARAERIAQQRSAQAWERAPQIEAAQAANRLRIAVNPAEANPTVMNKMMVGSAGDALVNAKAIESNLPRWNQLAREDMGLPANTQLTPKAFEQARDLHAAPYNAIRNMGTLEPSDAVLGQLNDLKLDPLSTSSPEKAAGVNAIIDRVSSQIGEGLTGENVLGQIRGFRKDANKVLQNPNASPIDASIAEAQLGVANALENLVESNITDPKALQQFRDARTAIAKTYNWERATGVTTKQVDPMAIVKMAEKGAPLTGTLADVANVAGNFPRSSGLTTPVEPMIYQRLRRGGAGGTIGFAIGGGPVGAAIGAGLTSLGGEALANRLTSRAAQNRLAMPKDYRLPLNANDIQFVNSLTK